MTTPPVPDLTMEPRWHEIAYFHQDGRVRWGNTPPRPLDGWTRRVRTLYAGPWRDDVPENAPGWVRPDSFGEATKEKP